MALRVSLAIEGIEEALKKIRAAADSTEAKALEGILLKGARVFRSAARRNVKRITGNLYRSIRAFRGRRKNSLIANVYAGTDRRTAHYDHLVEYGHRLVRKGKAVGHVPPHPFFRPAIDQNMSAVSQALTVEIQRHILNVATSGRVVITSAEDDPREVFIVSGKSLTRQLLKRRRKGRK